MFDLQSEHLHISLKPVDFELERMPSFCSELKVVFLYRTGSMIFENRSVWFGFDQWNDFVVGLCSQRNLCKISDFGLGVNIEALRNGSRTEVSVNIRRPVAGVGEGGFIIDIDVESDFWEKLSLFSREVQKFYLDNSSVRR